ncbi:unnamed protein product [Clonostachys rhizophaga]|uniref:Nudix hydrolase domain-containing protein n=1 Tax=Clonostachys rhizophaga TaxID=160324 RepID=A0A9N9VHA9_9HYPO|nr:unnamed protein product [Clonostachys rhizophaga]
MAFQGPIRCMAARATSARKAHLRLFASTARYAQDLKRRAVVGSFLLRRDPDGVPEVALFRRTNKVNTYQHKYATISGGIEPTDPTPLAAAKRELREETTLDAVSDLRFLCRGAPYSFIDRKANYEWSVHPFAFRLPPGSERSIRLGFEHESYRWFPADQIPVPELAAGIVESLRRVWPEGPLGRVGALSRFVLREDDELTNSSVDAAWGAFAQAAGERLAEGREEWWRLVRLAGWHVWNNSDAAVRGEVLGRVVPALGFVRTLVEEQGEVLAEGFEKLVARELESVRLAREDDGQIAELSDRLFGDLWEVPEEVR